MTTSFTTSGLITGLDTNSIITQLMLIERKPITRAEDRISVLKKQKEALGELRTQLFTLRNKFQDFRLNTIFDQYRAASSNEKALTVEISGSDPVIGSYAIDVLQLASATEASSSSVLGSPVNPNAAFNSSGIGQDVEGGIFSINGVQFSFDPDTQSLNNILGAINSSAAGVTATYDAVTDKVTFANTNDDDTSVIIFGGDDDTSDFLSAINITNATQSTGAGNKTYATSTRNLGAVNPADDLASVPFANGAVTSGTFRINGITITIDAATDSISDVLTRINDSDAQVTASYDTSGDTIKIVSNTLGSRTIRFESGTSNFLDVTNLTAATQVAGNDARFTVNGGAAQTRNTNEVSDAIGGVTLNLLSVGASTVTVSGNDDAVVEKLNEFLTAFNDSVDKIRELTGSDGALAGDSSLQAIENYLRSGVFAQVTGYGDYKSLPEIGITTGDSFDSSAVAHLQLDEEAFREALRDDRLNIRNLFANTANTGIADTLYSYVDEISRTTGFLNARAKSNGSIDVQIRDLNDQIDRIEERVTKKETRLRTQFANLEKISATYQQQSSALSALASTYSIL
ncbi:MAG TPA: flagellar filament capping protein FliD [Candidatus Hydrogenedentes bacterium]|nr:flagellar filament capping protein FliD [Candidatus Hydrogenedentota bacterium]HPG66060.1 flagellar filament capping protein FliD [Candidatus Hydrogenedentota bacterium]